MATAVEFKNVSKRFEGMPHPALDRVNLTIEQGELVCVLGTSGGSKTTFIKLINRLHDPDEGTVLVEGRDVHEVDPVELRRGIGYVIQQIGLFPHMTVRDNVATVPKILKWDQPASTSASTTCLALLTLIPTSFATAIPPSSPAASSSASASPARSQRSPRSCSSMSPSGHSMPSRAQRSKTSCCAFTADRTRPSSS